MTDLEMTKLCAEAIRISVVEYADGYDVKEKHYRIRVAPGLHGVSGPYQPLKNDAQAMALVKAFKLGLSYGAEGWIVDGPASHHLEQDLNRGICKAVARMQIEKEKNA